MSMPGDRDVSVLVARAREAFEGGRLDEARRLVTEALSASPRSVQLREFARRLFPDLAITTRSAGEPHGSSWDTIDMLDFDWGGAVAPSDELHEAPEAQASFETASQTVEISDAPGLDLLCRETGLPASNATGDDGASWGPEAESHQDPRASDEIREDPNDELKSLLEGARDLFELADFSGSLELVEKALALRPDCEEAKEYQVRNQETLVQMYESKLGRMDRVPAVAVAPDEVVWLSLDNRTGYLLSQIDGTVSFEDLYALSGMSRLETSRILARLVEEGIIVVS